MPIAKWTALVVVASLAGCSSGPGGVSQELAKAPASLIQLNELLHASAGINGRPPTHLSDLDKRRSLFPQAYDAVKIGDIVVLWGTRPTPEGEIAQGGEQVLAYQKTAPTEGGYVLFSGGTIKKLTAAEFAAAPKGGKAKG
jgi:hypothetical protein